MNYRMKKHALTIMADTSESFTGYISIYIYDREPFFGIWGFHNDPKIEKFMQHLDPLCRYAASPPEGEKNLDINRFFLPPLGGVPEEPAPQSGGEGGASDTRISIILSLGVPEEPAPQSGCEGVISL
jgi:hypothetical protein